MMRDLADRLERAAVAPSRPLDAAALVDSAIARRRRHRIVVAAAVVAVVAAVITVPALQGRSTKVDLVQPPPGPAGVASPGARTTPPKLLRPRVSAAAAGSGDTVWLWGGYGGERFLDDGLAVDAADATATPLPPSPLSGRAGAAAVWTGDELLLIGGERGGHDQLRDGATFDPRTRRWSSIEDAPASVHRAATAAVVTDRVVLWGGVGEEGEGAVSAEGAAYDLAAGEWTALSPAPLAARYGHTATAAGSQMLVWGGGNLDGSTLFADGASYDAARDRWEELPDSPLRARSAHSAVWTGEELIVWGGRGAGTQPFYSDGAAYDPRTGEWRMIAPSPLTPRISHAAGWTGETMVVWGGRGDDYSTSVFADGATYDPTTDTWAPMAPAPLAARSDAAAAAADGSLIIAGGTDGDGTYFGDAARWSAATDTWTPVTPARRAPQPREPRESADTSACFDPSSAENYGTRRSARADVDGDGRDDAVSLVGTPGERGGPCDYFVVARTGQTTVRRRLPAAVLATDTAPATLSLAGFYELNDDPGYEIVVQTIRGATGAAHAALTFIDAELQVVVELDGEPALFGHFSSAGHGNAADCIGEELVRSGYGGTKKFTHYKVTREFFTVDEATIVPARSRSARVPYDGGLQRFPEFSNGGRLFRHCAASGE